MTIEFFVAGYPVAQGRPKFFVRRQAVGKQKLIGSCDPEKSKSWKESVKWQAIEQKAKILDGPLWMALHFKLIRPKSLPKKVQHHVKKPDLDNLVKAVKDGIKGICYLDDSQVVQLAASKEYSDTPGVIVKIGRVE